LPGAGLFSSAATFDSPAGSKWMSSLCTNRLMPHFVAHGGCSYEITIETGAPGVGRLTIAGTKKADMSATNPQEVDLTPSEMRSFAQMLLSTAELVEANESLDTGD
jgi:hypothetical protein